MSQVLVTESYLRDIASAIRAKRGTSASYTPSQMAAAIGSIQSAGALSIISKTISANGSYAAVSDNADAFSDVVVNVSNTYSASDEGKVVSSGALTSQGSMSVSANSTYDTTLINEVVVDVPSAVLVSKTITSNGTYNPADDSADAYSQVVVDVPSGGGGINKGMIEGGLSSLYDSICSNVRSYCFQSYSSLMYVEMTDVEYLNAYAFSGCMSLTSISFPKCISAMNAFYDCEFLTDVYMPLLEYAEATFSRCYRLSSISLPKCSFLGGTFYNCSNLTTVYAPNCSIISNCTFVSCKSLNNINIESCSYLGISCFINCNKLSSISLPNLLFAAQAAFQNCYGLKKIDLPMCKTLGAFCFYNCTSLESVFLSAISDIGNNCFAGCSVLESIYILSTSICSIYNSQVFKNTPIMSSTVLGYYGSIFVPESMVSDYKTAIKWSYFSDRITAYMEA